MYVSDQAINDRRVPIANSERWHVRVMENQDLTLIRRQPKSGHGESQKLPSPHSSVT